MTIEIVDFPINSMVISHSYVNVYQRVIHSPDIRIHKIFLVIVTPIIPNHHHHPVTSAQFDSAIQPHRQGWAYGFEGALAFVACPGHSMP